MEIAVAVPGAQAALQSTIVSMLEYASLQRNDLPSNRCDGTQHQNPPQPPGHLQHGLDPESISQRAYHYTKLRYDEIRILTLYPAKNISSTIRCSLRTVMLHSPDAIFEALSYRWGSEDDKKPILLGGKRHLVTANLEAFLRHRRRKSKRVILWIDALCINQLDIVERSSQVALMGELYKSCTTLCIWLGPATNDSEHGINVLKHIGGERRWEKMYTLPPRDIQAVEAVFDREWFHRTWVVQELVLGAAGTKYFDAYILCGKMRLSWQQLEIAADRLNAHNGELRQTYKFVERVGTLERIRQTVQTSHWGHGRICSRQLVLKAQSVSAMVDANEQRDPGWLNRYLSVHGYDKWQQLKDTIEIADMMKAKPVPTMLKLLHRFRHLKVKDERDKIYAMSWFAGREYHGAAIHPNYGETAANVYRDFALSEIHNKRSLNIITHCRRRIVPNLPSWVPDWSVHTPETPLLQESTPNVDLDNAFESPIEGNDQGTVKPLYSATPNTSARVSFDSELASLRAEGFIFDSISIIANPFVADVTENWEHTTKFILQVAHCKELAIENYCGVSPYQTSKARLKAFWWTIFGNEPDIEDQYFPERARRFERWLPPVPADWYVGEPRITAIETGRLSVARIGLMAETILGSDNTEPTTPYNEMADLCLSKNPRPGLVSMGAGMGLDLRPTEWSSADTAYYTARFDHLASLCAESPYDVQLSPFCLPSVIPDPFWRCRKGAAWETVLPDSDQTLGPGTEQYALGRRFFITKTGYMGLAPIDAQLQDKIVVLLGCDAPMVVREYKSGFEVVGEAHVQGLMQGESLTGANIQTIDLF